MPVKIKAVEGGSMQFICAHGKLSWFRIETAAEAAKESLDMDHAVERYFREAYDLAAATYVPPAGTRTVEERIGLRAHAAKAMPHFLTLRNEDGEGLVTAMLPPEDDPNAVTPIIVGPGNADPYESHIASIAALARHYGLTLNRSRCYPYANR